MQNWRAAPFERQQQQQQPQQQQQQQSALYNRPDQPAPSYHNNQAVHVQHELYGERPGAHSAQLAAQMFHQSHHQSDAYLMAMSSDSELNQSSTSGGRLHHRLAGQSRVYHAHAPLRSPARTVPHYSTDDAYHAAQYQQPSPAATAAAHLAHQPTSLGGGVGGSTGAYSSPQRRRQQAFGKQTMSIDQQPMAGGYFRPGRQQLEEQLELRRLEQAELLLQKQASAISLAGVGGGGVSDDRGLKVAVNSDKEANDIRQQRRELFDSLQIEGPNPVDWLDSGSQQQQHRFRQTMSIDQYPVAGFPGAHHQHQLPVDGQPLTGAYRSGSGSSIGPYQHQQAQVQQHQDQQSSGYFQQQQPAYYAPPQSAPARNHQSGNSPAPAKGSQSHNPKSGSLSRLHLAATAVTAASALADTKQHHHQQEPPRARSALANYQHQQKMRQQQLEQKQQQQPAPRSSRLQTFLKGYSSLTSGLAGSQSCLDDLEQPATNNSTSAGSNLASASSALFQRLRQQHQLGPNKRLAMRGAVVATANSSNASQCSSSSAPASASMSNSQAGTPVKQLASLGADESSEEEEEAAYERSLVDEKQPDNQQHPLLGAAAGNLAKKSNSASQLSSSGSRKRLGFKRKDVASLGVNRSEETGTPPSASPSKLSRGGNTTTEEDKSEMSGSSHSWTEMNKDTDELVRPTSFIEGLGKGQMVSRDGLTSPYLGDILLSFTDRRGNLEVEVKRVRNLQPKANKQLPMTYVKLYMVKNRKCLAKAKTTLCSKRTLDPTFLQHLIFHEDYHKSILQAIVWGNFGKMDKKNFLGIAQISMDDLELTDSVTCWYKLFLPTSIQDLPSKSLRHTLLTNSLESFQVMSVARHSVEQQNSKEASEKS